METGCIPCLARARKCDVKNPACAKHLQLPAPRRCSVSDPVAEQWHSNWKERRGFQLFVLFADAPENSGVFRSAFWQRTAPLACLERRPLYCIASAIGALHEIKTLPAKTTSNNHASDIRKFALQQYNKALSLLTARTDDSPFDAEVAALACVLVTYFESLSGHTESAIAHCQQGRQLLALLDRLCSERRLSGLLEPDDIRPVIGSLQLQSLCISNTAIADSNPVSELRELILPRVSRLFNLEHAAATLNFSKVALMCLIQPLSTATSLEYLRIFVNERNTKFTPWLENWYRAFQSLQRDTADTVSSRDRQRYHILEINYMATLALAKFDIARPQANWESNAGTFEKIVQLSEEVLQSFAKTVPSSSFAGSSFPFHVPGLWVLQPLYFAMARCSVPAIQQQAARLLLTQVHSQDAASPEPSPDFSGDGAVSENMAYWTTENWVTYAKANPLDVGSAVFFGRFRKPDHVGIMLH